MKKHLLLSYLVFIHLCLGLTLLKSDFIQRVTFRFGINRIHPQELTPYYRDQLAYHARMDGNVPAGAVIFIGDSLVQGLSVTTVAPIAVNYGIGGDTTAGVLHRISTYQSLKHASAIVLAIGINDLFYRNNAQILANYSAILANLPQDRPVIISAILPVNEQLGEVKAGSNQRIISLNKDLKSITTQSKQMIFVDAGDSLIDDTGVLKSAYHIGDGLHLNAQGNAVWINHLQQALTQMLKPR